MLIATHLIRSLRMPHIRSSTRPTPRVFRGQDGSGAVSCASNARRTPKTSKASKASAASRGAKRREERGERGAKSRVKSSL